MKLKHHTELIKPLIAFCSALLISWVALPSMAAEDTLPRVHARSKPTYSKFPAANYRLGSVERGSKLLGSNVKNLQDEKLGEIKEMAIDLEAGQIVEVIISTGSILDKKLLAVPPSALAYDLDKKVTRLDVDKERLKAAPEFDMAKWSECCHSNRVVEVYHYYGCEPYWILPPQPRAESPKAAAERLETKEGKVSDTKEAKVLAYTRLGYVERASKVIGLPVRNKQDEKLGKVDDLIVDLAAGRLVTVVLSSGGFLGIGDALNAAPPQAFAYNPERDALVLDASKEALTSAPRFKSSEWPDLGDPVYVTTVYQTYHVEPYFDADNTGRNVRDRYSDAQTPLQQGNTAAEVETSARIRKAVLAQEGFSVNAHNVKIITSKGRVTLRGPVQTERERKLIGEIAARTVGAENVDNQLEVK